MPMFRPISIKSALLVWIQIMDQGETRWKTSLGGFCSTPAKDHDAEEWQQRWTEIDQLERSQEDTITWTW